MLFQSRLLSLLGSKKNLLMWIAVFLPLASFAQAANDVIQPPQAFDPTSWNWALIATVILTVLIILVIARAFDIGTLTEWVTGKKVIGWTKINAWLGIIVLVAGACGVAYELIYHGKYVLTDNSASEHGKTIDSMFMWTFWVTFAVFCITEILLFWFMFRYRYREGEKAHYYYHNNTLEMVWTIIPAIVLTFLVLRGFNTWSRITDPSKTSKDAQQIEVFAYQFGWKARYAGEDNKFGESNFTLISGTNPLGVAIADQADSLIAELNKEIKKIDGLIANADKYKIECQVALRDYEAKQNLTAYPKEYKEIKQKAEDACSGAYLRNLQKDKKRKQTNLTRIAKYRASEGFFNNAGNDDKITTEIVLVKGKEYVFNFRARDVIHSAYMPHFRAQINVVPGMATRFAFTPIKTTEEARKEKGDKEFEYYLYCNKICGAAHYNMKIKVTVVGSEKEYNDWIAAQAPMIAPAKPAEAAPAETGKDTAVATPTMALN